MKKSVFEQILEEMEQEKYRFVPDAIEAIDNGDEKRIDLFLHYNAETAAAMLEQRYDKIPPGTRFETALYHYTDKGDGIDIIRRVIKESLKYRKPNWRDKLPESVRNLEEFTVYRATCDTPDEVANSLSWTLCKDIAEWFVVYNNKNAGYELPQHIYKATIPADKIIAFLNSRDEFEILQFQGVENIQIIPIEGQSKEFRDLMEKISKLPKSQENNSSAMFEDFFNNWYRATAS